MIVSYAGGTMITVSIGANASCDNPFISSSILWSWFSSDTLSVSIVSMMAMADAMAAIVSLLTAFLEEAIALAIAAAASLAAALFLDAIAIPSNAIAAAAARKTLSRSQSHSVGSMHLPTSSMICSEV